jgi:TM2 domain-containing membrane protein YozV
MDIDEKTRLLYDQLSTGDQESFSKRYEVMKKKPWVYYLLLLFLGGLGAHRFYLDQTNVGILFIFTGGLFGFGNLFDLFTGVSQVREYNERLCSKLILDYTPRVDGRINKLNVPEEIPNTGLM